MAICEQCGKEHEGTFGSGRFCCRSCSNKWVALNQSDEAKARKVAKGQKNLLHDNSVGFCSKDFWTPERREAHREKMNSTETRSKLSRALIEFYKNNPDYPTVETRQRLSVSMKESIAKGRRPGYLSLKRSESYPEKYWTDVLNGLGIEYIREFRVSKRDLGLDELGSYFLDFLLPGNVDLEIDGSQHYGEQQRSHDLKRDSYLSSNGYKVYRVRWRNPLLHSSLIKEDIDNFVSWYESVLDT